MCVKDLGRGVSWSVGTGALPYVWDDPRPVTKRSGVVVIRWVKEGKTPSGVYGVLSACEERMHGWVISGGDGVHPERSTVCACTQLL